MSAEVGQPAPEFTLPGIAGEERLRKGLLLASPTLDAQLDAYLRQGADGRHDTRPDKRRRKIERPPDASRPDEVRRRPRRERPRHRKRCVDGEPLPTGRDRSSGLESQNGPGIVGRLERRTEQPPTRIRRLDAGGLAADLAVDHRGLAAALP